MVCMCLNKPYDGSHGLTWLAGLACVPGIESHGLVSTVQGLGFSMVFNMASLVQEEA